MCKMKHCKTEGTPKTICQMKHELSCSKFKLTELHICHRTRIPFGHVLIERTCGSKHCKTGCIKKRKTNPPQTTKVPCQITKQQNRACEIYVRWNSVHILTNTITLTAVHSCHRTRIPFWHVRIERMCFIYHWTPRPTTKSFQNIKQNKTKRVRILIRCRVVVFKNSKTQQWKTWRRDHRKRERECTYSLP